jgi:hypothetical protein
VGCVDTAAASTPSRGGAASSPHVLTRCDVHNSILEDSSCPRPPPCGLGSLRGGPARTSERGALGAARVRCWALWILHARHAVLRRTLRAASRHEGRTNAARASRVCVSPKGVQRGPVGGWRVRTERATPAHPSTCTYCSFSSHLTTRNPNTCHTSSPTAHPL